MSSSRTFRWLTWVTLYQIDCFSPVKYFFLWFYLFLTWNIHVCLLILPKFCVSLYVLSRSVTFPVVENWPYVGDVLRAQWHPPLITRDSPHVDMCTPRLRQADYCGCTSSLNLFPAPMATQVCALDGDWEPSARWAGFPTWLGVHYRGPGVAGVSLEEEPDPCLSGYRVQMAQPAHARSLRGSLHSSECWELMPALVINEPSELTK